MNRKYSLLSHEPEHPDEKKIKISQRKYQITINKHAIKLQ